MALIYHTFFAEFKGETAGDILRAVHMDAAKGSPINFDEWWRHQQVIWKTKYGVSVPKQGTTDAETKLLKILVEVGALESGSQTGQPKMPVIDISKKLIS